MFGFFFPRRKAESCLDFSLFFGGVLFSVANQLFHRAEAKEAEPLGSGALQAGERLCGSLRDCGSVALAGLCGLFPIARGRDGLLASIPAGKVDPQDRTSWFLDSFFLCSPELQPTGGSALSTGPAVQLLQPPKTKKSLGLPQARVRPPPRLRASQGPAWRESGRCDRLPPALLLPRQRQGKSWRAVCSLALGPQAAGPRSHRLSPGKRPCASASPPALALQQGQWAEGRRGKLGGLGCAVRVGAGGMGIVFVFLSLGYLTGE